MTDSDDGFTASELSALAWFLAIVAVGAWLRIAFVMDHPDPVSHELGLWLAVASLATVFSAACMVLSGVKGVAARLTAQTDHTQVLVRRTDRGQPDQ